MEKFVDVLNLINEINREYKFLKFVLDKDGDINIEYDLPHAMEEEYLGAEVMAIFVVIATVVDEVYGRFMNILWN